MYAKSQTVFLISAEKGGADLMVTHNDYAIHCCNFVCLHISPLLFTVCRSALHFKWLAQYSHSPMSLLLGTRFSGTLVMHLWVHPLAVHWRTEEVLSRFSADCRWWPQSTILPTHLRALFTASQGKSSDILMQAWLYMRQRHVRLEKLRQESYNWIVRTQTQLQCMHHGRRRSMRTREEHPMLHDSIVVPVSSSAR